MSKTIKKTILDVLEDFAERQPNLSSSAARETIAKRLHDALFGEFTPDDYPYNIESGAGRTEEEIDAVQTAMNKDWDVVSQQKESISPDLNYGTKMGTTYSIVENLGWAAKNKKQKKIGEVIIFEGEIK